MVDIFVVVKNTLSPNWPPLAFMSCLEPKTCPLAKWDLWSMGQQFS